MASIRKLEYLLILLSVCIVASKSTTSGVSDIKYMLEQLVTKHKVPALGGIELDTNGITALGAAGIRKKGSGIEVTSSDLWHIGSCTKAMTATMIASLVEYGVVQWEDTLGEIFPWLPKEYHGINYIHLLSHRSGIPATTDWKKIAESAPTLEGQRVNTVNLLIKTRMEGRPGQKFLYSDWGYVVAAAMAENKTEKSYESLMQEHLFAPLAMTTVGYGPTSRDNELTQPWGHTSQGIPIQYDNPLVVSPAGTIHLSLEDWGKFIRDQLKGSRGQRALLSYASYSMLHTPPFDGSEALGWFVSHQSWSKGPVLDHTGTNHHNHAFVVIALKEGTASMAVCNQGDTFSTIYDVLLNISRL